MTHPFIDRWRPRIEAELSRLLPAEKKWPATLHRAMRHSVFAGGKRLRPLLALAAGEACGGELEAILSAACGLEMIHTYSLIHDDLPALDNDDWRRGVPTCHKVFGEAAAILAGDALLTHGLGCIARFPEDSRYDVARGKAANAVVDAIGTQGMIGGQMEDLEAEKDETPPEISAERLERIHSHKTGKLIGASLCVGGILSFAQKETLQALHEYGRRLGLAFQIKDDLLDIESTREELGKATHKDSARGKLTFPGVHGLEASRQILRETVREAGEISRSLEPEGGPLRFFAEFVSERTN